MEGASLGKEVETVHFDRPEESGHYADQQYRNADCSQKQAFVFVIYRIFLSFLYFTPNYIRHSLNCQDVPVDAMKREKLDD